MADHYDDNAVIAALRRAYFGDDDASGPEIFADYKTIFSALPQTRRRHELLVIDDHLTAGDLKPTRETAATLSCGGNWAISTPSSAGRGANA